MANWTIRLLSALKVCLAQTNGGLCSTSAGHTCEAPLNLRVCPSWVWNLADEDDEDNGDDEDDGGSSWTQSDIALKLK